MKWFFKIGKTRSFLVNLKARVKTVVIFYQSKVSLLMSGLPWASFGNLYRSLKEHTIYHMCHEPQLWTTTHANPNSVTYLRLFKLLVLDAQQEMACFQHNLFCSFIILYSRLNSLSRFCFRFWAFRSGAAGLLNVGWVRRVDLRGSDGRESTQGRRPLDKGCRWWGWVVAVFQTAPERIHNTDLQCKREIKLK